MASTGWEGGGGEVGEGGEEWVGGRRPVSEREGTIYLYPQCLPQHSLQTPALV